MNGKFLAAAIAVALSGCASTQEVMREPVTQTFQVAQKPDAVAFCLGNKNNAPVLPGENGEKIVLIKNGYGGVSLAFSIFPDGEGSRVEYRKKFGTVGGIWKQCVGLKQSS